MLGFVEEIVLLLLDDGQEQIAELPVSAAHIVIAGAALMELALRNRIDTDVRTLVVVNRTPTGDDILDDALAHLDELAVEASRKTGVPLPACREYLGGLDYAFNDHHRTALTDFLRRAGSPQFVQVA